MHGIADPDRALALTYALADRRLALAALFRLDEALGQIVRGARDPLLGQMRLTWWHEALSGLSPDIVPPDPVLADLLTSGVVPGAVDGVELAGMIDGWEGLLEEPADLTRFATDRGGRLFAMAGRVLGEGTGPVDLDAAGGLWALADLARHSSSEGGASEALSAACVRVPAATAVRWPGRLRALGALTVLAARDVGRGSGRIEPAGHPRRMVRALRHRLTGR